MKKIKSTLFLAIFVAISATTTLASGGQIPIAGTPVAVGGQIPIAGTPVAAGGQIPIAGTPDLEISNYLWTFASIIGQLKF